MKMRMVLAAVTAALALNFHADAADTYRIDPAHSVVGFSARHMGISHVRGKFKEFAGTMVLDGDAVREATATIQVQSVDTGVAQRDDHLRASEFFDAPKFPTITFKTKRIEKTGDQIVMVGDFTMRGVTKELRLPVSVSPPIKDPWGNVRIGLEARAKVNRKDYGISFNQVLETGAVMVGEEVQIEINAEAVKDTGGKNPPAK